MTEAESLYVFTAGCNGLKIYEFITLLHLNSIKLVLDTRLHTHYQHVGEFGGKKLKAHLEDAEIVYRHFLPLAPTKALREELKVSDSRTAWGDFLDGYKHHIKHADPVKNDPEFVQLLNDSHRILLLCAEQHFEDCHRDCAAQYLKESLGNVFVEHLMKDRPKRDTWKMKTRGLR